MGRPCFQRPMQSDSRLKQGELAMSPAEIAGYVHKNEKVIEHARDHGARTWTRRPQHLEFCQLR